VNKIEIYRKVQIFFAVCDGVEKFMLSNTTVGANLSSAISRVPEEDAMVGENEQNR
jgi:hypothetical protein